MWTSEERSFPHGSRSLKHTCKSTGRWMNADNIRYRSRRHVDYGVGICIYSSRASGKQTRCIIQTIMAFECAGFTGTFIFSSVHPYLWTLAILFCFLAYAYTVGNPLNNIPGPLLASRTRLWLPYRSWRGDLHRVMIDLHNKDGRLVTSGLKEISVSDSIAIRTMYGGLV